MTASKYAISQIVTAEYAENAKAMENTRNHMRYELGGKLVEIIDEEIKRPTVIRLRWNEENIVMDTRITLIADIQPTEIMHVVIPDFEHWNSYGVKSGKVIEWGCGYCGQVNVLEKHLECRKCGAPRKVMR